MRLLGVRLPGRPGSYAVEFEGERIRRVEPCGESNASSGFMLLPGLVDSHVHLTFLPPGSGREFTSAGVMTVRDVGGECAKISAWARAAAAPALRILPYGPPLDGTPPEPRAQVFGASGAAGPQDVDRHLDRLLQDGAAGLKLYFGFPPELLRHAVTATHSRGLRVAAHLGSGTLADFVGISPQLFAESGGDTVEHVHSFTRDVLSPDQRAALAGRLDLPALSRVFLAWSLCDPDTPRVLHAIDRFAATGAFLVPTLSVLALMSSAISLPGVDIPSSRRNIEDPRFDYVRTGFDRMLAFLSRFHDRGGRLLVGTDLAVGNTGIAPGEALATELRLMRRAGISAEALLAIATEASASALKLPGGHIEPGFPADMILARAGDADEFLESWPIQAVIHNGVIIHGAIPAGLTREEQPKPERRHHATPAVRSTPRVTFRQSATNFHPQIVSAFREIAGRLAEDSGIAGLPFSTALLLRTPHTQNVPPGKDEAVLPVMSLGPFLVVGPLQVEPHTESCTRCFLYAAFGSDAPELEARMESAQGSCAAPSRRLYLLLRAMIRAASRDDRPVYIFDTRTAKRTAFRWEHPHPRCPGHAWASAGNSDFVRFDGALASRVEPVADAGLPWRSFIDGRCGILRKIERPAIRIPDPAGRVGACVSLFAGLRSRPLGPGFEPCVGVGTGLGDARIKAVMEGIERWCLEAAAHRPVAEARRDELSHAIDPAELHLYTDSQYALPDFPYRRWRPDLRVWWTEGYDPLKKAPVWVPLELVANMWPKGAPEPICQLSSIGCAAHRSYPAAALRAILEVIERDAVMRWWFRITRPGAAWRWTFAHRPTSEGTARQHALTVTEIGWLPDIPVYLAAVTPEDGLPPHLALGAAASLNRDEAIHKASIEAVVNAAGFGEQSAASSLRRHMQPREHGEYYARNAEAARIASELFPTVHSPPPPGARPDCHPAAALALVLEQLEKQGFTPVLVDLTPPGMRRRNVYVIRAVIPQLIPMSFGLGQERWGRFESSLDPGWRERIRGIVHPFP